MSIRTKKSKNSTSSHSGPQVNTGDSLLRFQSQRAKELLEDIDKIGEPIFQPEDINKTSDIFSKLVRMYCVDQKITYEYLYARHRAYSESLCMLPHQINYDRNNFKRALVKPTMTKSFFETFAMIMGLCVADISLTLITPNNTVVTYKLSEAVEMSRLSQIETSE